MRGPASSKIRAGFTTASFRPFPWVPSGCPCGRSSACECACPIRPSYQGGTFSRQSPKQRHSLASARLVSEANRRQRLYRLTWVNSHSQRIDANARTKPDIGKGVFEKPIDDMVLSAIAPTGANTTDDGHLLQAADRDDKRAISLQQRTSCVSSQNPTPNQSLQYQLSGPFNLYTICS